MTDQERVRLIVERASAIAYTEWSKMSHVIWRDWLIKHADSLEHEERDTLIRRVGIVHHHEMCIRQYDLIILALRRSPITEEVTVGL